MDFVITILLSSLSVANFFILKLLSKSIKDIYKDVFLNSPWPKFSTVCLKFTNWLYTKIIS